MFCFNGGVKVTFMGSGVIHGGNIDLLSSTVSGVLILNKTSAFSVAVE